ncbi:glycosyltransferase [Tautonia marina]|uniref:glycosyltransferase n=1 Tax=Tautonia marina TaxID=2653855 RepID=UPI00126090CF|nr:glycosyltransferase [Tautonia marina]
MRIGVDVLAIQSPYSRGRGIGRYARSLLAAMLEREDEHEYILYTYEDLSRESLPTSSRTRIREVRRNHHQGEHTLQHAIERSLVEDVGALDWFLLLSPFETWEFYGLPHRPVSGIQTAAVVYDLIPFLFQETYLVNENVGRWFYGHLRRLCRYDRLLAISEATRQDTLQLLGLPPSRVQTIGTASEPSTHDRYDSSINAAVLDRLGIDRPFLFCLGSSDPRKNLQGLIDAFALLPAHHRDRTQLVVTCSLIEAEVQQLRRHAEAAGISDQLVLTNAVDQETLITLYRSCVAFVFPSLYEGFGLPILEAMQLGAPVIAANNSSQPEVLGNAGLLTNAAEPSDLATAMVRLLENPSLRQQLGWQGQDRSEQFRWSEVADRTLRVLEAPRPQQTSPRGRRTLTRDPSPPRIAIFSPLPPTPSGIARYTERICTSLRDETLIDLYHAPSDRPALTDSSSRYATFDASMFDRRRNLVRYEATIYQFGNSSFHTYLYEPFLNHPGIVVLHDQALAGFHASYGLMTGRMNAHLIDELNYSGHAHDSGLAELVTGWKPGTWDIQDEMVRRGVTMNRRILERATAILVHSQTSRDQIAATFPWLSKKVHVAPIGCDPDPIDLNRKRKARRSLGLDDHAVVLGAVGILHPTKLNRETIRAFANALSDLPQAVLLFVGRDLGNGEARCEAARLGVRDRVRFLGHLSDDDFERAIDAFDVGLSLRRPPTNGESSAALLDLLRRGLPTVVCDVGTFAEYPDAVVRKISWTDEHSGVAQLGAVLRSLVLDTDLRQKIGQSANDHVRRSHTWAQLLDVYRRLCFPDRPADHTTMLRRGVA